VEEAKAPIMREASNITMYEKRLDSDRNFIIRAQAVNQETNNLFTMKDFSVDRSDGMKITGSTAKYDTGSSVLKISGPITILTSDGWKATLTDLVWDRRSRHAVTDMPVLLEGEKGRITAARASSSMTSTACSSQGTYMLRFLEAFS
jgi:hypothetical protein